MVCNGTTNHPSEKGLFTVVKVHSSNKSYMYTLQDRDFPLFLHYEKQEGRESKSVGNLCLVVVVVVVVLNFNPRLWDFVQRLIFQSYNEHVHLVN